MTTRSRLPEQVLVDYVQRAFAKVMNRPLYLGGGSGAEGGVGTTPGGYVGQLPQKKVTRDTSEIATYTTSTTASLWDNLNAIRAMTIEMSWWSRRM